MGILTPRLHHCVILNKALCLSVPPSSGLLRTKCIVPCPVLRKGSATTATGGMCSTSWDPDLGKQEREFDTHTLGNMNSCLEQKQVKQSSA